MSVRRERVAEAIRKEISDILHEMKDPRIGLVSVVAVEVSRDVRYAKAFVSVFGEEDDWQKALAVLQHAKGHIRSELARRSRLRYTPEIEFRPDRSIAHGAHIARLLKEIGTEQAAAEGGAPSPAHPEEGPEGAHAEDGSGTADGAAGGDGP